MSSGQFSQGLEIIAAETSRERFGSRIESGGLVSEEFARVSFEEEDRVPGYDSNCGHQRLNSVESFIEDLPATREYQEALAEFLSSLSLRLAVPKAVVVPTLSGVPIDLDIHWPFVLCKLPNDFIICVQPRRISKVKRSQSYGCVLRD